MFHCYLNTFFIDQELSVDQIRRGEIPYPDNNTPYWSDVQSESPRIPTPNNINGRSQVYTLTLGKQDLDKANKDKKKERFGDNLKVMCFL